MQITDRWPYSYRSDPQVPAFDDRHPVAFMDGSCALCCFGARLIARLDRAGVVRICPVQTSLGGALLRHYGLDQHDPDSWLLLDAGVARGGFDAMAHLGKRCGGWGHGLRLLMGLPRPLREALYQRIARSRYRLFGRADLCGLPDAGLRARLLQSADE
ncbi:MAG: thiol-disulfide oxidoreductase DCC family protein [Pseudomarimonas sp.]